MAPTALFTQPYGVNRSFSGFKPKRPFKMNVMHRNTDNISHAHILAWPGITSWLTLNGSGNDINQYFFLKFLSGTVKFRWKSLMANQNCANLHLVSVKLSFKKTSSLKTFLWIFPHPNFMTNTITFHVTNSVNIRFVYRVLWVYRVFQMSLQSLDLQSDQQVLLNLFWGCIKI